MKTFLLSTFFVFETFWSWCCHLILKINKCAFITGEILYFCLTENISLPFLYCTLVPAAKL